jgi:5,10-methylenetetrahydrofolate reductase
VVAREVSVLGGSSIAVLNARDRNLLGLQRDILTAVESGTNELLFVGGDPSPGTTSALSTRTMMIETRAFCKAHDIAPITIAVASGLATLPTWKHDADEVFLQASFSLDDLLAWREHTEFDGPVYAGVIVVPSASRARKWSAELPGITVPDELVAALDDDGTAGVAFACDFIDKIERSGAFDGVHLIAGVRYREMASHLHLRRRSVAVGRPSK